MMVLMEKTRFYHSERYVSECSMVGSSCEVAGTTGDGRVLTSTLSAHEASQVNCPECRTKLADSKLRRDGNIVML